VRTQRAADEAAQPRDEDATGGHARASPNAVYLTGFRKVDKALDS
jgi:hypothetical protein